MKRQSILVQAIWDSEAEVFVATSDDVPGLITEAATPAELLAKLKEMIPELLNLNGYRGDDAGEFPEVPLTVIYEQLSKVRLIA
jgi:predicted RNase H-like HicB family nuclease